MSLALNFVGTMIGTQKWYRVNYIFFIMFYATACSA